MKILLKISPFLLIGATFLQASDSNKAIETSKTFFFIRPPFQTAMPEKETMWRDRALAKECGLSGALQVVPFGGQSTHAKHMAKYFMICTKSELVVAETNAFGAGALAADPNLRDINAIHFNIQTTGLNFKSTIQFRPKHSFYGVGIDYKQYLHPQDACEKYWWLEVSAPVMQVRNDMKLEEAVTGTGTPISPLVNTSMVEAFKGKKDFFGNLTGTSFRRQSFDRWHFGKIDGAQKETGIADIELKLGYDFICKDTFHSEAYIGMLIPTGNKPKAEFVFEPIIGHNHHWGFMWGSSFGWEIWNRCDKYLHLEMASNTRYLFEGTEWRSFDIKGKPWSRYMLVYRNLVESGVGSPNYPLAPVSGINIFTRKMKVKPRYMYDINTSLVYTWCNFQTELGYNLWIKGREKIRLDAPWQPDPLLAAVQEDGKITNSRSNRAITIKENFENAKFNINVANFNNNNAIQEQDLDLKSAASPAAITHTLYGSIGYWWDDWCCYPLFVGAGGSYELSQAQGSLSRWTAWGKVGISI